MAETVAEMDDIGWRFVEHPPPLPRAWVAGLQRAGDGQWESTASPRPAGAVMNHLMRATTSEHYPVLAAEGLPILLLTATEPEQRRRDNEERTARLLSALPYARAEALSRSGHDLLADPPGRWPTRSRAGGEKCSRSMSSRSDRTPSTVRASNYETDGDPSSSAFSRARSLLVVRRIACSITGAVTREKPEGLPRLRSVIHVPSGTGSHV